MPSAKPLKFAFSKTIAGVMAAMVAACCSFGWDDDDDLPTLTEAQAQAFFNERIQPILAKKCWECHGDDPEDLGGGLALTSPAEIHRGGESGPAIDPHDIDESILLSAINYDLFEMPPDGKLSKKEIADLTLWVKLGMPWPTDSQRTIHEESEAAGHGVDWEAAKSWWSFQPVAEVVVPQVNDATWPINEVDHFILQQLEARGFKPAPAASRAVLIRRAYYDLIGLPPLPEQVEQFVNDPDPQAYEKLIDRLLESPHYGEKWGRHWLDLVRYAESNSFERDGTKPFVWRYRDYVIQSFNDDKPYDQFLIEQLAGDELPDVTLESLTATGYYRLGQWDDEPADPVQARFDDLDDILATTSQAVLGLTVNCARCHDHKIDPILQSDYYKMLAVFSNIRRYGVRDEDSVREASLRTWESGGGDENGGRFSARRKELREIEQRMSEIEAIAQRDFQPVEHEEFQYEFHRIPLLQKRVGGLLTAQEFEEYCALAQRRDALRSQPSTASPTVLCVKELGTEPEPMFVRMRGNPHVLGDPVEPGLLSILGDELPDVELPTAGESSGRRLALAKWIAADGNPLTARVMANRLWQYHFGRGLVRSANDFGLHGDPPTHPQLLDWLARELVGRGWQLKAMHRLLMRSQTYRMSSDWNPEYGAADPTNDAMWRFNMRRLTAEEIRDSILFVNGSLNLSKMYGPSVFVNLPAEVLHGQSRPGDGWGESSPEDQARRSIYIHVKRSLRVPLLEVFDGADTDSSCPVRFVTTLPTQALGLLNSQFCQEQAATFSELARQRIPEDDANRVRWILARVTQRPPTPAEVDRGLALIADWKSQDGLSDEQAWRNFCLLALNLNEFVFLD